MATIEVNGFPQPTADVKTSKSRGPWQSWNIYGLAALPLVSNAAIGAGLTGSTISGVTILPQFCKIPKVAIFFGAIDVLTGTETFNIFVEAAGDGTTSGNTAGVTATYTPGAQTVGYADNSQQWGYPNQAIYTGTDALAEYSGPVFFPTGSCLFATDVKFNTTNFPLATTTDGGGAVLATTNYDGVFAAGTVLSARYVTTASTGSIAHATVVLFVEPLDIKIGTPSSDSAVPILNW
jgi:hypothetical protein